MLHILFEGRGVAPLHFRERQLQTKLRLGPGDNRLLGKVFVEEYLPLGKVELLDGLPGLLDQEFAHIPPAELLEVAFFDFDAPPRMGHAGQGAPIPFAFDLFVFLIAGQILVDLVLNMGFCRSLGLIAGKPVGLFEIHPPEIFWLQLGAEPLSRPGGEHLQAIVALEELGEVGVDLLHEQIDHHLPAIGPFEQILTKAVDAFSLLVHDFVVFEQVLASLEVPLFDLFLGRFDPPADHAALDPLALFHAERFQDRFDPGTGEDPHQVVFERQIETAAAGVSLASAAAAELQIDTAGVMPLGADHVQAAEPPHDDSFGLHLFAFFDLADQGVPFGGGHIEPRLVLGLQDGPRHRFGIAAQNNVGTAARHVGGDGDGPEAARLSDDLRFALVLLGVEHLVLDAALVEELAQPFALLDGDGSHQDRPPLAIDTGDLVLGDDIALLAFPLLNLDRVVGFLVDDADQLLAILQRQHIPLVDPLDLVGERDELFAFVAIDHVRMFEPEHLPVGRNGDDIQTVDLPEFARFGHGRTGHAADLVVQLEKILERNRRRVCVSSLIFTPSFASTA